MSTVLGLLLLVSAVAVGLLQGLLKVTREIRDVTALVILLTSNAIVVAPRDSIGSVTWWTTYAGGLLETGIASVVVHVLPFYLAYAIVVNRRTRS